MKQHQIHRRGGYAYTLQKYDTDKQSINGYDQTSESNNTSSLTAERYDTISILLMIAMLGKVNQGDGDIRLAFEINTDNKEVINRATERPEPLNISETMVPEYDSWCLLMWDILDIIDWPITCVWIKGHQDRNEKNEHIHKPLLQ